MRQIFVFLGFLAVVPAAPAANECPGTPYRYTGERCSDLGLDTNRAVCLPGRRFALLCDDAVGGRVRTCQSGIRCDRDVVGSGRDDRRHDDRGHGYAWHDHGGRRDAGAVYFRGDWRACETLRFDRRGEPAGFCKRGTFNRDCRGRCERY